MVRQLDRNLAQYARIVVRDVGVRPSLRELPGAGAAGGLGFGLCAFLGARLRGGIEIVLDQLRFDEHLRGADLVITGEGAIDAQTIHGKVPIGVARRAKKLSVPVIAIGGTVPPEANSVFDHGIHGLVSICHSPMSLSEAMRDASSLIELAIERSVRLFVRRTEV
jgi:glycerate kinase